MLLPEAVALALNVLEAIEQLRSFEDDALNEGVPVFDVTVTLPVAVQPLLCVTVTLYVPAPEAVMLEVVCPPGLHR